MSNKISREFIMDFENGIVTQNTVDVCILDEECRICFEDGNLIYPCNCSAGIHLKCLKKWILSEQNTHPRECEICRQNYRIAWNKLFCDQNIFVRRHPPPPPVTINRPPPPPPPPPSYPRSNANPRQIIPRIDPDSWTDNEYIGDDFVSRIITNERNRISHNNRMIWFQNGFMIIMIGDLASLIIYFSCGNDTHCSNDSGLSALIFSGLFVLLGIFYWLSLASVRASVSNIR